MMIRRMIPEDVKQVAAIEAQCFSIPWSEKSFLDSLDREDTIFLVAVQSEEMELEEICAAGAASEITESGPVLYGIGGQILGYIGMYISFEEGEITNVAVCPDYRTQGIGNLLVTAMQAAGREKNLERIVLEVRVSNEKAISVYTKNGFTELGIRKNFYEMPTEDAIIMACEL